MYNQGIRSHSKEEPISYPVSIKVCDTEESCRDAIELLQDQRRVLVDCEGVNLGATGGALCLLGIAPADWRDELLPVYLIDVSSVGVLPIVQQLLENRQVTKVFFDCRMDASALHHSYNVSMDNVYDLQLLDILDRVSKESFKEQCSRLSPTLHYGSVNGQPNLYTDVHKLNGLISCAKEKEIATASKGVVDHSKWNVRPLSDEQLRYVSSDFHCLRLLFNHFENSGTFDDHMNQVAEGTRKYMKRVIDNQPPPSHGQSSFENNSLLPLGILDTVTPPVGYNTKRCGGCKAQLSRTSHFSKANQKKSDSYCNVCRAIHIQQEVAKQWGRSRYDDDEWYEDDEFDYE